MSKMVDYILRRKTCRRCLNAHHNRKGNQYFCLVRFEDAGRKKHLEVEADRPACVKYTPR